MNRQMWEHPAVQRNVAQLEADGARILGPAEGDQACGETGPGRMMEPDELADALEAHFAAQDDGSNPVGTLAGVRVLVTAGPTREHIDPVRFISNHSSGKQGYAMARAARAAGATVTLVSGPVHLGTPAGVRRVDVTTARDMQAAVATELPNTDLFIGVAAVGDYRPLQPRSRKIKKAGMASGEITLPLQENPDILESVVAAACPCVVGFAAETHDALAHAREKLARKGCDAIIVNDVSDPAIGFDSEDNAVVLIQASRRDRLSDASQGHPRPEARGRHRHPVPRPRRARCGQAGQIGLTVGTRHGHPPRHLPRLRHSWRRGRNARRGCRHPHRSRLRGPSPGARTRPGRRRRGRAPLDAAPAHRLDERLDGRGLRRHGLGMRADAAPLLRHACARNGYRGDDHRITQPSPNTTA